MLGRITVTRMFSTSATPSAVWAALEATPRWPEVLPDLVSARIEPDGVLANGATIHTVAKPGTRAIDMSYSVVAAEPRLRLVIESAVPGQFRARSEYLIDTFASGTRIVVTSHVEPVRWLHRIVTALMPGTYAKQLEAALELRLRPMLTLAERIQQS
jgi:Polyketide cyclase / dehydrase and lipid transport